MKLWHECRRVLVCGGRDYTDEAQIFATLDALHAEEQIGVIIHGNARGADAFADCWALSRGIKIIAVPAEWSKFGKAAGPKRNAKMLGHGPKLCVAFPGGSGTRDMVKRAEAAGVEVLTVSIQP